MNTPFFISSVSLLFVHIKTRPGPPSRWAHLAPEHCRADPRDRGWRPKSHRGEVMATVSPAVRGTGPGEAGVGGLTGVQEGNHPTQDGHEGHGSWGALKGEVERFARLDVV